ncbi:hypothetical protein LUU34_00802900 [Aix galericulata]|nr:hypothetical protein LUU34_00802900 [Aix galericulata]
MRVCGRTGHVPGGRDLSQPPPSPLPTLLSARGRRQGLGGLRIEDPLTWGAAPAPHRCPQELPHGRGPAPARGSATRPPTAGPSPPRRGAVTAPTGGPAPPEEPAPSRPHEGHPASGAARRAGGGGQGAARRGTAATLRRSGRRPLNGHPASRTFRPPRGLRGRGRGLGRGGGVAWREGGGAWRRAGSCHGAARRLGGGVGARSGARARGRHPACSCSLPPRRRRHGLAQAGRAAGLRQALQAEPGPAAQRGARLPPRVAREVRGEDPGLPGAGGGG